MRHSPLHAALHHLMAKAHGPLDRRLRHLASGQQHVADEGDEEELHNAIANELGVDGRPPSMEMTAHEANETPEEEMSESPEEQAAEGEEDVDPAETHTEQTPKVSTAHPTKKKRQHLMRF